MEWEKRIPFWDHIVDMTYAFSFLEVGCNAGWNLKALREISPSMTLCGVDINESAVKEARDGAGFTVWNQSAGEPFGRNFDLVFTAGLLIYIPLEALDRVMGNIARASRRFVLAVEYADEKEVEVEYRGHTGKLWRRPYGKIYENMDLKLIDTGLLDEESGFDSCTYWLLKRP